MSCYANSLTHSPDSTLDTAEYPYIRNFLGSFTIAGLLPGAIVAIQVIPIYPALIFNQCVSPIHAHRQMIWPMRMHIGGCLHCDEPEVIICKEAATSNSVGETATDNRDTTVGGLASSLFFKRCDGVYKNLKGEVMEPAA